VKIGVISDTHDFLDPRVKELFADVDHILHAGDIGTVWITFQLEQIAQVTAVYGNTDSGLSFKEAELIELDGQKFLVQHIVDPRVPDEALRRRITRHKPHFVIFGHTHKAFDQTINGVRFFNPGYAGRPRFNQPRSVAILQTGKGGVTAELLPLADSPSAA
jgi:putative phosphoesterase